jgi:hypothetical protein
MPAEAVAAPDFWRGSGWRLLERDARGRHLPTDDFLRAYLLRPELVPVEESCSAERALHASVIEAPRRPVTPVHMVALKDPDARENWGVFLAFRERLLRHGTLEDAYLDLVLDPSPAIPPLLLDQLAHAILRGILNGRGADGLRLRAAECLFRTQKVTVRDGAVMLADEEMVEMHAASGGLGGLGRLLVEAGAPLRTVELDVIADDNAAGYAARSDRFDTVLDVSFTRPGLDALCRVLEEWVAHFLDISVSIQPLQTVRDERWAWHTGLDAEATGLLNDLYQGKDPGEARLSRLISLFRLEFRDASLVRPGLAGRPVYLGMARDARDRLRLKPQNLLVNLPLAGAA